MENNAAHVYLDFFYTEKITTLLDAAKIHTKMEIQEIRYQTQHLVVVVVVVTVVFCFLSKHTREIRWKTQKTR